MFKSVALSTSFIFLLWSPFAKADTITPQNIAEIHAKLKTGFIDKCHKEMTGATDQVCNCLGDKLVLNLDDKALSQCTFDLSGSPCVVKILSDAAQKTVTKENINSCIQDDVSKQSKPAAITDQETISNPKPVAITNPEQKLMDNPESVSDPKPTASTNPEPASEQKLVTVTNFENTADPQSMAITNFETISNPKPIATANPKEIVTPNPKVVAVADPKPVKSLKPFTIEKAKRLPKLAQLETVPPKVIRNHEVNIAEENPYAGGW